MDRFLPKRDAGTAIGEVPLKNREADTDKSMCPPSFIGIS
jgi:hypothetical protein